MTRIATGRRMPKQFAAGQHGNTVMAGPMIERKHWLDGEVANPFGYRVVMGYFLPPWQRGLVWTVAQQVAFIESAWRGIGLGTYTINRTRAFQHPLDNLLIDGQQRMFAIQCYIEDRFPVFGWHWSEVTEVDRRYWEMSTTFASYTTDSEDEDFLRAYYDMMNFGGVSHTPDQRAASPHFQPQGEGTK